MADEKGYAVNDPEHIAGHSRETNGWGFTREDLEKHGVTMTTEVRLAWSEDTPPEMRLVFGEASHVLHFIAENAIMAQLEHDGLKPTRRAEIDYGTGEDGVPVVLRQSGWEAT